MSLAIYGGKPVRSSAYPQWPHYDKDEENALLRSLRQGQWWRVGGSEVDTFEEEFAQYHEAPYALAVTTGTHALELALMGHDITEGDEVIVPAFTFISTSMAVQRAGATPVPVDVDPTTYCIDIDAIEAAINERTKAIIPVHMSGHFCDMQKLEELATKYNLIIIQDAAHAHGARGVNRTPVGKWNSTACFSFQNFKLMTAGEGGLITCPSESLREKLFLYGNCGRPLGDKAYMHEVCGSNYRMNEFSAAVLRSQLKRLSMQTETREQNAKYLYNEIINIDGITPQGRTLDATVHPYYMFMFCIDESLYPNTSRDFIVDSLVAEGIPAYKAYKAIYRTSSFWKKPCINSTEETIAEKCPNTEHISKNGVWIHHRALLGNKKDALDVVTALRKILSHQSSVADIAS